jgi:hypothetical protein
MEITANEKETKKEGSRGVVQASPFRQKEERIGPDGVHRDPKGPGHSLAGLQTTPGPRDGCGDGLAGQLVRLGDFLWGDPLENQLSPYFLRRPTIPFCCILFHRETPRKEQKETGTASKGVRAAGRTSYVCEEVR